ncbi:MULTISPECIES: TetR/AcrR family transcriptional regulator [Streptomyces]|uniref:TetR/AcrR family transcriptional regulator n=1 Tax=Streptomyces morookaense TaxID=1970 RepID=A0A7Y7B9D2_STRMO|nr:MULTISPECIES: TetR/AcrR family transcriptional regulator [Streptomyces]MCC2276448.1 TetR/AcrR family transcriptional regulator [Streptomyces sp. ET3-23]NVK81295.1 TetR/AcrR family transcriptional regulator [Streptomyces morookaense]
MSVDRDQVLRAAAGLLTRKPTASMDEIAKTAGIGRATLHRHFSGRDALVRALENHGIERLGRALDEARPEEGDAADAVRRMVACIEPVAGIIAFLYGENQLYEGGMNEGWNRLDARITGLFRRGQEEGAFRLDLSPAWLTEALYGLVASGAWAVQDGRVAARDISHMVSELLLGGALRRRMEP